MHPAGFLQSSVSRFIRNYYIGMMILIVINVGYILRFPVFVEWYYVGIVETVAFGLIFALVLTILSYFWKIVVIVGIVTALFTISGWVRAPALSSSFIFDLVIIVGISGSVVALHLVIKAKGGFLVFSLVYSVLIAAFTAAILPLLSTVTNVQQSQLTSSLASQEVRQVFETAAVDISLLSILTRAT